MVMMNHTTTQLENELAEIDRVADNNGMTRRMEERRAEIESELAKRGR